MKWWKKFRRLNPPVQWLFVFIISILILALAFAPRPKPIDYNRINFTTTADSRLYFQNMRSFYYNIDTRSKKPMIIYRLKRRTPAQDALGLQFSIVQHPLAGNAYAYSELGQSWKQYDSLYVEFSTFSKEKLGNLNSEDHYRIAAKVFSSILQDEPVYLVSKKDTLTQLYADEQLRLNAEVTLEDFFKLTNKN